MDQNLQNNGNGAPNFDNQNPWQQQVPPRPVVINQLEHKKDGLAVCSLVTGIVSLMRTGQHTGLALAGVILSAIGLVLCVAILLLLFLAV